jgi:hypothetical protein
MADLSVLEQQQVIDGGNISYAQSPPASDHPMPTISEWGSKAVPNAVAGIVVGAVGTLIILRAVGFRFSFGVNVGGGS